MNIRISRERVIQALVLACIGLAQAPTSYAQGIDGVVDMTGFEQGLISALEWAKEYDDADKLYAELIGQKLVAALSAPKLAMSLNDLGINYRKMGRFDDAIKATQGAVKLYDLLARQRPDLFVSALKESQALLKSLKAQPIPSAKGGVPE